MPRHTRNLIVLASLLAGCAAADGGTPALRADALEGAAGSAAPAMSQAAARCAFNYAQCLLRDPFGILPCTERAEACGLFDSANSAGTGMPMPRPDTSPTCALRMAECIARNPFRAPQCASNPCP